MDEKRKLLDRAAELARRADRLIVFSSDSERVLDAIRTMIDIDDSIKTDVRHSSLITFQQIEDDLNEAEELISLYEIRQQLYM